MFIELTEESLRKNFPKINFGQRKECMKIINEILSSKDKFIFSDVDKTSSNEIFDKATVKAMSPVQLSVFLQDHCHEILEETIICFLDEEVDGESFLDFTDESLVSNFPDLSSDQRISILKIIANAHGEQNNATFQFVNHNVIEIPFEDDLGCSVLQGFIENNGVLVAITGQNHQKVDVAPCVSGSFLAKRKKKSNDAVKRPKFIPEEVEPLDVLSILKASHQGEKVIEYINTKGVCRLFHQKNMMRILYEHHCADKESPLKYYPLTLSKIAMAKGIVTAFPKLADKVGDCIWASWLEVVKTKFETVQSKLQPSQKKNVKSNSKSNVSKTAASSTSAQSSSASHQEVDEIAESEEIEETINNQIQIMGHMLPTIQNKLMISLALTQTYPYRRKWILHQQPSVTDILLRYKHLKSYEGEMISEEFRRIHKLHDDVIEKFKRAAPFIMQYAKNLKPALFQEVTDKFTNDNVAALVLLSRLLNVTLNKNTSSPEELEHVKNFKRLIEAIPSSALFQVAPEGTDVESYISVETHPVLSEHETPIFPYLLWVTRDFMSGMIYMKIDKQCFLIERFEDDSSIVRALDIFVKAHHVFMLKYHPYLKTTVFDYFEYLYGIKKPLASVARFVTALSNLAE